MVLCFHTTAQFFICSVRCSRSCSFIKYLSKYNLKFHEADSVLNIYYIFEHSLSFSFFFFLVRFSSDVFLFNFPFTITFFLPIFGAFILLSMFAFEYKKNERMENTRKKENQHNSTSKAQQQLAWIFPFFCCCAEKTEKKKTPPFFCFFFSSSSSNIHSFTQKFSYFVMYFLKI